MGGDNERSEPGTAPAWLSLQRQEQGDAGSEGAIATSASLAGRRKSGAAVVGLPSRCMSAIEAHSSGVNDVIFEKGGVLLATAGDDSYVKVWDPGSGRQRAVLKVSSCGAARVSTQLVPRFGVGIRVARHTSVVTWPSSQCVCAV